MKFLYDLGVWPLNVIHTPFMHANYSPYKSLRKKIYPRNFFFLSFDNRCNEFVTTTVYPMKEFPIHVPFMFSFFLSH